MSRSEPMRPIPLGAGASIGDFRRYPGCRMLLTCAACAWCKGYNPERVIWRLQQLRAGGHATRLTEVGRRVQWPCPACSRLQWRVQLAWPPRLDAREARRLAGLYRN